MHTHPSGPCPHPPRVQLARSSRALSIRTPTESCAILSLSYVIVSHRAQTYGTTTHASQDPDTIAPPADTSSAHTFPVCPTSLNSGSSTPAPSRNTLISLSCPPVTR